MSYWFYSIYGFYLPSISTDTHSETLSKLFNSFDIITEDFFFGDFIII